MNSQHDHIFGDNTDNFSSKLTDFVQNDRSYDMIHIEMDDFFKNCIQPSYAEKLKRFLNKYEKMYFSVNSL